MVIQSLPLLKWQGHVREFTNIVLLESQPPPSTTVHSCSPPFPSATIDKTLSHSATRASKFTPQKVLMSQSAQIYTLPPKIVQGPQPQMRANQGCGRVEWSVETCGPGARSRNLPHGGCGSVDEVDGVTLYAHSSSGTLFSTLDSFNTWLFNISRCYSTHPT